MADTNIVPGHLRVGGDLFAVTYKNITRSMLTQDAEALYPIPWEAWYIWDSGARLPNTSASDDLGFYPGTFATNTPSIRTYDLKNAGATNVRARATLCLPPEYQAIETVKVRFHAGMITTVASSSATIDLEAYISDNESAVSGSDLVTTSATTINSLTHANKDFTLTSSSLAAGTIIDMRVTIAINDSATATAVIGAFGAAWMLLDLQG